MVLVIFLALGEDSHFECLVLSLLLILEVLKSRIIPSAAVNYSGDKKIGEYSGEKTASSISGAEKTRQLHVEERN